MTLEFDNRQAANEGWVISDCEGSENGPWQLQRIDDDEVFPDDAAAWRFVSEKAREGSEYHKAALAFLEAHNPIEANAIRKFIGGGQQ